MHKSKLHADLESDALVGLNTKLQSLSAIINSMREICRLIFETKSGSARKISAPETHADVDV